MARLVNRYSKRLAGKGGKLVNSTRAPAGIRWYPSKHAKKPKKKLNRAK